MAVKELIEYIAKAVVDQPEAVSVQEVEDEGGVIIELRVAPEDKGKVIGREGHIAQAMRTLLKVASIKEGRRATLEIV